MPEPRTVVFERTYHATLDEVWALWTTKDGFESWWGPQGFRAEVHEIDARPGGTLRYDMIASAPEMIAAMKQLGRPASHPTRSRFSVFEPRQRLTLTNMIDFLPGVTPYESTIAVVLSAQGERVRMVVTLSPMHSGEMTEMQSQGFGSQLEKLDARFAVR